MKIGELFVALGFKVEGRQQFDDAERALKRGAVDAGKLTLAINAVNVALLALMNTGTRVAVGLKNFGLQTGLSRDQLQKWQHEAEVNDVTAQELTATIEHLQDVRASFALGEPKDVGAWALLGIDPRQDPFTILDALRARLLAVQDVGVARNLAARVGISGNLFQMLRSSNDEFAKFKKSFEVTKAQEDRLIRLNRAWKDLRYNLQAVRVQFAAAIAPALELLSKAVGWVAEKVAALNAWLNSSVPLARAVRFVLGALAAIFIVLGTGAAVATAALAALAAVVTLLSPGLVALLPLVGQLAVFISLLVGFIVALVLAVDDMWMSFSGGKSVLRDFGEAVGEWLAQFRTIQEIVNLIDKVWTKIQGFGQKKIEWFLGDTALGKLMTGGIGAGDQERQNELNRGEAWFAPKNMRLGESTVNQTVNVDVAVDGARSPEATGKAVGRSVKEEFDAAARQLPAPNR